MVIVWLDIIMNYRMTRSSGWKMNYIHVVLGFRERVFVVCEAKDNIIYRGLRTGRFDSL